MTNLPNMSLLIQHTEDAPKVKLNLTLLFLVSRQLVETLYLCVQFFSNKWDTWPEIKHKYKYQVKLK